MKKIPETFDVQSALFSKENVRAALVRDGAVILSGLDGDQDWSAMAASVPHFVWDAENLRLGQKHRADPVHVEHRALSLAGEALHPHADGYIWGDAYPDVVILVCESPAVVADNNDGDTVKPAPNAGANYLLDGHDVFAQLDAETKHLLETTLVDHTERSDTAFVDGAVSIVPLIRWLAPKGWREKHLDNENNAKNLCWRRMVGKDVAGKKVVDEVTGEVTYASLWTPVTDASSKADSDSTTPTHEQVQAALHTVDWAIAAVEAQAARFALKRGQALIVDNYRMLHSREAFHGLDEQRRMWRVWAWTDASLSGLPPAMVEATRQAATNGLPPANILEAQQSIQAHAQ